MRLLHVSSATPKHFGRFATFALSPSPEATASGESYSEGAMTKHLAFALLWVFCGETSFRLLHAYAVTSIYNSRFAMTVNVGTST
ncbi:hypothetical protein ACV07N_14100 [Roseivirga echinicomitans]